MKTTLLDFIVTGLVMIGLISVVYFTISSVIAPYTAVWFGSYHIVVDAISFLFLYGIYSGILLQCCLLIYPLKCGIFSMEDPHFFYWKFITVIHEFGRGSLLPFTTVFAKPPVSALFGAKMGKNIAMGGLLVDPWFITVSDNAILGLDTAIIAHAITSGRIILKTVTINKNATIGVHAVLMPGVVVGENAIITAGSVVTMDTIVPPNEMWGGMPARKIKDITTNDIRG